MGIEGGGRFEMLRRHSSEGRFEPDETRRHERRAEYGDSWIAGIIDPEKLARIREYPAAESHSVEWLIMQSLLGKLVESGPEMDPHLRARLRNLVATFRVLTLPNLNLQEQDFMRGFVPAVDWSSLRTEVTPETIEDIHWVWGTFGLRVPSRTQMQDALGDGANAIHKLLPRAKGS